jgi:hypothetical protein
VVAGVPALHQVVADARDARMANLTEVRSIMMVVCV